MPPVLPQVTHAVFAASHAKLADVQNRPTPPPAPLGLPGQHPAAPIVPHEVKLPTPVPPVHERIGEGLPPFRHVPSVVSPHDVPAAMHMPSTQQSPPVVQLFAWQQGLFVVPQPTDAPLSQTPVVVVSPDAKQTLAMQHPPPLQAAAVQQACPAPPHPMHLPPAAGHTSAPPLQEALAATHIGVAVEVSQQPPFVHTSPVQHGSPVPPHAAQLPPVHTLPVAHGVAPLQHASPVAPQTTHAPPAAGHTSVPALHEPPAATHVVSDVSQQPPLVQVLVAQHGSVVPPHVTQAVPLHTSVAEHALPVATHVDVAQHAPVVHGVAPAQHGSVAAPHATHAVPLHTWATPASVAEQASCPPMHLPVPGSQHSPAVHVSPEQHCCPTPPQAPQVPPAQTSPPVHAVPDATHLPAPVSQQPLVHALPEQQRAPVALPHVWQVPPEQTSPFRHAPPLVTHLSFVSQHPPVQALLAQHASPPAPHTTHDVPEQTLPVAQVSPFATHCPVVSSQQPVVHMSPAQHDRPGAPQVGAASAASAGGPSEGASLASCIIPSDPV